MKVTVVIPSIEKTQNYLRTCVKSLRDSGIDWDIIVVTNGGAMYELENLSARRVHTSQQGQCHAVNIGVQMAAPNTDYIMVSNDDMYYAPGWDKYLRFDDLCFSPNLMEPVKPEGSADPFLIFDGGFTLEEFKQDQVNIAVVNNADGHHQTGETKEVGFNLPFFIKKEVWDAFGGYDEAYDPWGSNSDTDLQTLIELAGVTPQRLRDVIVYHFGSKSGTFDGSHQELWWRNFNYYTDKFGFNRDQLGSDTWYCKDMVDYDKLVFKPDWLGKYGTR